MGWQIQQKAIQPKLELTDNEQTSVIISNGDEDLEIILYRSAPDYDNLVIELEINKELPFYFEERSSTLLSNCRALLTRVIEKAEMFWNDVDDVVLAGGSCRMPMIPKLVEELSGKKIPRNVAGFSYDTAIAMGAAIYGIKRNKIKDVTSKTIGIEVKINGRPYIEHLIKKNTLLPVQVEKDFFAEPNAVLKIYEGESNRPEECLLRGRLELKNREGMVTVMINVNEDGVISCIVELSPNEKKELEIITDDDRMDKNDLRNKISAIDIRS
jgi:molecular chaperone DnaK (HSP70)